MELQKPPAELIEKIAGYNAERSRILDEFKNFEKYSREMNRLNNLLRKYKHRWAFYNAKGERTQQEPSQRMYDWVDRYNILTDSPNFLEWCECRLKAFPHDAYDVLS